MLYNLFILFMMSEPDSMGNDIVFIMSGR